MALERAPKMGSFKNFKFERKGDQIDGYYVKTTNETINNAPAKKHVFMTKDGPVSILGQANLYKQLVDNECLGIRIVATFTGEVRKLQGGRTVKLYDLDFDRGDRYSGGDVQDTTNEPDYSESESFGAPEEAEAAESYAPPTVSAPRRPTLDPVAQAQRVKEALAKSRPKTA